MNSPRMTLRSSPICSLRACCVTIECVEEKYSKGYSLICPWRDLQRRWRDVEVVPMADDSAWRKTEDGSREGGWWWWRTLKWFPMSNDFQEAWASRFKTRKRSPEMPEPSSDHRRRKNGEKFPEFSFFFSNLESQSRVEVSGFQYCLPLKKVTT